MVYAFRGSTIFQSDVYTDKLRASETVFYHTSHAAAIAERSFVITFLCIKETFNRKKLKTFNQKIQILRTVLVEAYPISW